MKITDLLTKESIMLGASPAGKKECLEMAVSLMEKTGNILDRDAYLNQVLYRESEGTTGIGDGIAIPHGKCRAVTRAGLAAMVIPGGVEYEALDEKPVDLLFLIAAPDTGDNIHLDILAKVSRMLIHENIVKLLRSARTAEEFLAACDKYDEIEEEEILSARQTARAQEPEPAISSDKSIVAVTACFTGIVNTYIAAEAIKKAAGDRGCRVKVETRAPSRVKNLLTEQEIEYADGIIVAVDREVPTSRFKGRKVIFCSVEEAITDANALVDRIIAGDVPLFEAKEPARLFKWFDRK